MEELFKEIQSEIDQLKNERDKYKKAYGEVITQLLAEKKKTKESDELIEKMKKQLAEAAKTSGMVESMTHYIALVNTVLGPDTSELLWAASQRIGSSRAEKEHE